MPDVGRGSWNGAQLDGALPDETDAARTQHVIGSTAL